LKRGNLKIFLSIFSIILVGVIVIGIVRINTKAATVNNFSVDYEIQNDWGNGCVISLIINNTGDSDISDWILEWEFSGDQEITNMWNANYTQEGQSILVENLDYNSTISAGNSINFGFSVNYTDTNEIPSSFVLTDSSSDSSTDEQEDESETPVPSDEATPTDDSGDEDSEEEEDWESNTGTIELGSTISYTGDGVSVDGSTINITKGGDFVVTGTLSNGMIKIDTEDRCKLRLSGCSITNSSGPAIYVDNSAKAFITITEGTTNTLTDGNLYSDEEANSTIFSNDDIEIKGKGTLTVKGNYDHAISGDDDVIIENGEINITSLNDGINANASVEIKGGNLNINASGDSIQSGDEELLIEDGILTLAANSQALKSDTGVTINAGEIEVTKAEEGVEAPSITINGGVTNISASDDSLNATNGNGGEQDDGSKINISGGEVYLSSTTGDSLDSNGSITISDGVVIVHGPESQIEVGVDCNGTFTVSGGLVAVSGGNSNMTQYPTGASNQYSLAVMFNNSISANTVLCVKDSSGSELITFKPEHSYYSFIFSSPELQQGQTYDIYTGGSVSGGTETNGLITGGTYNGGTVQSSITITDSPTTTDGNFNGGNFQPW
jgi:hypothetical protein